MAISLLSVPALRLCHARLKSNFSALGIVAGVGTPTPDWWKGRIRSGQTQWNLADPWSLGSDEIKGTTGVGVRPRPRSRCFADNQGLDDLEQAHTFNPVGARFGRCARVCPLHRSGENFSCLCRYGNRSSARHFHSDIPTVHEEKRQMIGATILVNAHRRSKSRMQNRCS